MFSKVSDRQRKIQTQPGTNTHGDSVLSTREVGWWKNVNDVVPEPMYVITKHIL